MFRRSPDDGKFLARLRLVSRADRSSRRHLALRRVAVVPVLLATGAFVATSSGATSHKVDVAAAKALLAPYTGKAGPFPVTTPLSKRLPKGTKFVYLQAADPVGALLGTILKSAVQAIGGNFSVIDAGVTASSAQTAAASALSEKPAVVMIPAFLPSEFGNELKQMTAQGIKVVGAGMINAKPYGVQVVVGDQKLITLYGQLLAAWVAVHKGAGAHTTFYTVPELSFTGLELRSYTRELAKLCPSCTVRSVPVSAAGTTSAQTIANDLQSNPSSNVAVFSTMDVAQGLPAAMSAAGINNVLTVGASPTPENLADIKSGALTAGLAIDIGVYTWSIVDAGARLVLGDPPAPGEEVGAPLRFLSKQDLTFDPSHGWTANPNYPARFMKLWHR